MKGNRFSDTVKEYARKVSDDDLRYLHLRLSQRIGSDVAESIELLQRNSDIDHWLSQAKSASDFFDMIDIVDQAVQNETKRRFAGHEQNQKEKYRS